MPRPRESPYIWATWLAKLLAGENSCEWAGWFRSHYQDWTKQPSDFDSTQWMLAHTALVNQVREDSERLGYTVFTENQNSFRLRGRHRHPGGEADLIVVKGGDAVVIDAKTGKPGPAHAAPGAHLYVRAAEGTRAVPAVSSSGTRALSRITGGDPSQRRWTGGS